MTSADGEQGGSSVPPATAILAGGCVGLLVGAGYYGVLLGRGDAGEIAGNAFRAVLAGGAVLLLTSFVLVLPLSFALRRRHASFAASMLAFAGGGLLVALLLSSVIGALGGEFWLTLGAVLTATFFCLLPALVLARPLATRPVISRVLLVVTSLIVMVALVYVVWLSR